MGFLLSIIAIVISFLINKALCCYIRFLLSVEPDNSFQKVLLFGIVLFFTLICMNVIAQALIPGKERKSVVQGNDYWGWDTGRYKREGILGTIISFVILTVVTLILIHLVTLSSPILFVQFFRENKEVVWFWNGVDSLFLELPAYLIFVYYLVRPFKDIRD